MTEQTMTTNPKGLAERAKSAIDNLANHAISIIRRQGDDIAALKAERDALEANNKALRAALIDLRTRYTSVFDIYIRPTYQVNSNPDNDLDLALKTSTAALASAEARSDG
jgi:hypothetical protein